MYAQPGSLVECEDATRPDPVYRTFTAICGACGCWQELKVARLLFTAAAVQLTPADCYRSRGWYLDHAQVRCAFCTGARHRPEGSPLPLPEKPLPEIQEVRP